MLPKAYVMQGTRSRLPSAQPSESLLPTLPRIRLLTSMALDTAQVILYLSRTNVVRGLCQWVWVWYGLRHVRRGQ